MSVTGSPATLQSQGGGGRNQQQAGSRARRGEGRPGDGNCTCRDMEGANNQEVSEICNNQQRDRTDAGHHLEGSAATDCDNQQEAHEFVLTLHGPARPTNHRRRLQPLRGNRDDDDDVGGGDEIQLIQYKLLREEPELIELLVECRRNPTVAGSDVDNTSATRQGTAPLAEFKVAASRTISPGTYVASCRERRQPGDAWHLVVGELELKPMSLSRCSRYGGRVKLGARCAQLQARSTKEIECGALQRETRTRQRDGVIRFRFCQLPPQTNCDSCLPDAAPPTTWLHLHRAVAGLELNPINPLQACDSADRSRPMVAESEGYDYRRASVLHLVASICLSHLHASKRAPPAHQARAPRHRQRRPSPGEASGSSSCESVSCRLEQHSEAPCLGECVHARATHRCRPGHLGHSSSSSTNTDSSTATNSCQCGISTDLSTATSDTSSCASASSLWSLSSAASSVATRDGHHLSSGSYSCRRCLAYSRRHSSCLSRAASGSADSLCSVLQHTSGEGRCRKSHARLCRKSARPSKEEVKASKAHRDAETQAGSDWPAPQGTTAGSLTSTTVPKLQHSHSKLSLKCPNCKIKISSTTVQSQRQMSTASERKDNQTASMVGGSPPAEPSPPIRVEGPAASPTSDHQRTDPAFSGHLSDCQPIAATRSLLSPMDFVWRGVSQEARALSCTEASLASDSSSIVAQLAAASRSKSLCTESQAQSQLARLAARAGRSPGSTRLPKSILGLGERVGRLTRSAINQIRLLSASNPNMGAEEDGGSGGEGGRPRADSGAAAWYKRRASSQRHRRSSNKASHRGSGGERPLDEVVLTHKLNRFNSASAANLGAQTGSHSLPAPEDEDELFYSPDGIYLGPGGVCSRRELVAVTTGGARLARGSLRPQGGAASWLVRPLRSSLAQALVGSNSGLSAGVTGQRVQRPKPPPVIISGVCSTPARAEQRASGLLGGRSASVALASGDTCDALGGTNETSSGGRGFASFQSKNSEALGQFGGRLAGGNPQAQQHQHQNRIAQQLKPITPNRAPVRTEEQQPQQSAELPELSVLASEPNGVILYAPSPPGDMPCSDDHHHHHHHQDEASSLTAASNSSGTAMSNNKAINGKPPASGGGGGLTKSPWILNLTRRYHSSTASAKGSPPASNRASQKKREKLAPCESSKMPAKATGGPHLSKEARSNSLSGLYHSERQVDLSQSFMDLRNSSLSNYGRTIAEQTSLYLAELNSRYSGSTHELTPPLKARDSDHWFRRASSSSVANKNHASSHQQLNDAPNGPPPDLAAATSHSEPPKRLLVPGGEAPEVAPLELYGANLQSICVHCQLIAELANHPASAYLSQLISGTSRAQQAEQKGSGGGHLMPAPSADSLPVRPSVVLTVCSNQGTVDEDDSDNGPLAPPPPPPEEQPAAEGGRSGAHHSATTDLPGQVERNPARGVEDGKGGHHVGHSQRRRRHKHHKRKQTQVPSNKAADSQHCSSSASSASLNLSDDDRRACGRRQSSSGSSVAASDNDADNESTGANLVATDDAIEAGSLATATTTTSSGEGGFSSSSEMDSSLSSAASALSTAASQVDSDGRNSEGAAAAVNNSSCTGKAPAAGTDKNDKVGSSGRASEEEKRRQRRRRRLRARRRNKKKKATIRAVAPDDVADGTGAARRGKAARGEHDELDEDVEDEEGSQAGGGGGGGLGDLLTVPGATKQARSASLDAPYLLKVPERQELEETYDESYPGKSNRSRSVDISLPTRPGEAYTVRRLAAEQAAAEAAASKAAEEAHEANSKRRLSDMPPESELIFGVHQIGQKKFIQGEMKVACANGETRALKMFVDWQDDCINGEHLWIYAGSSSEACYVGENECLKHGPRLCCSACKITTHTSCISILIHKIKFICKHTFKDLTLNNPRHIKELQQHNVIYHHWVHKRTHCGRCKQCTKTFGNTKLPFSSKEIQAITCSWCKVSYHNKENCYTLSALTEPCTLGAHRESIIPPVWILKLPSTSCQQTGAAHLSENGQEQANDELPKADNLQDSTLTNQNLAFRTGSDSGNKENIEAIKQQHLSTQILLNRSVNQHYLTYGSNTTLMTDTSGYMSADGSNVQSLITSNQANNQFNKLIMCDNLQEDKARSSSNHLRNSSTTEKLELIVDPTALQMADLLPINQAQNQHQLKLESQLHPQESNNQFQRHQVKQYYRQLDANQNIEQLKSNLHDNDDSNMDIQLAHSQQQPSKQSDEGLYRNFRIVPQPIQGIPNAGSKPVLVFVNPRSGGNQGAKMMQKFNWLLNPRQVFDLIQSNGPRAALELYRDVPNLRILTIGGDGTASWILSYLDEVGIPNRIPVAVLPLGTGNDLARALGWGSGYADEPIAKILTQVRDGEIVQLDRWNLHVERNYEVTPSSPNEFSSTSIAGYIGSMNMETSPPSNSTSPSYFGSLSQSNTNTASTISIIDQMNCDTSITQTSTNTISGFNAPTEEAGSDRLPMDVINNYFSFGVDAHIALEFHTAREAHPERFNSRLRNKMFYGQAGGKDLLKRKWKDLSNFVTLYCDGQDMTHRLKELKVHSVLFLNIPSYGGGTRPWPTTATSFAKPRTDDGLIEVIGLTTYQLPLLQAGGHGTCIAQCRNAKIITSRTIPMQVDGEPCKLLPSIININFKNRVCMLAKSKNFSKSNMTAINTQKNNC